MRVSKDKTIHLHYNSKPQLHIYISLLNEKPIDKFSGSLPPIQKTTVKSKSRLLQLKCLFTHQRLINFTKNEGISTAFRVSGLKRSHKNTKNRTQHKSQPRNPFPTNTIH